MSVAQTTVFEQATRVFDGWTDEQTGLRVLRLTPRSDDGSPAVEETDVLRTIYHQYPCFLENGRKVLLRGVARGAASVLLDLTTGHLSAPFPEATRTLEVCDKSNLALLAEGGRGTMRTIVWDLTRQAELAAFETSHWRQNEAHFLSDGERVIIQRYRGTFYEERCHSRFYLMDLQGRTECILDDDAHFCNHIQTCPTDPEIYSYNRWPTPMRPIDVVLHLRTLDASMDREMLQNPETVRPGHAVWGGQRDHYVWTPDGRRIASYFIPDVPGVVTCNDHFSYPWWISVMDWRTGEDLAAQFPPHRWGCNFQVSPDSRYVVTAGGREFECIYLIDIEGLREGWNERPLCFYPTTERPGENRGPFPMPFVLPDKSAVIFTAGWPSAADGAYMVEWPADA